MATAHHDLSEQMVQQILSSTPPLAEQIRQDPENKEYTELGSSRRGGRGAGLFGLTQGTHRGNWSGAR